MRRLQFWCSFTATQYADPRPLSPRSKRLGIGGLRRSHSCGQTRGAGGETVPRANSA